jgi:hypothetical protein
LILLLEWLGLGLEDILREETTLVNVNLLSNDSISVATKALVVHVRHLAHQSRVLTTVAVLVLILNI